MVIEVIKNEIGINTVVRSIPGIELYSADEAFFTGTATEIKPIIKIDKRNVGSGDIGPTTRRIAELYYQLVRGNYPKYKVFNTPVYRNTPQII